MVHSDPPVSRLGWVVLILAASVVATLGLIEAREGGGEKRWLLGVVGAPSMAIEPIRDEVQLLPWVDANSIVSELPGGYPVVANTRPAAIWRGVRQAHVENVAHE